MIIEIESSLRVNTTARRTPELAVSMYLDYMYKRTVLGLSTLVLCDAFSFIAKQMHRCGGSSLFMLRLYALLRVK